MRKKTEKILTEKIKKEILQEILQENKQSENIAKPEKPPVLHHSPEEIQSIRESFLKIFLIAITVAFICIIILLTSPFSNKKNKNNNINNDEQKEKVEINQLKDLEDGIIPNDNDEILKLFFMVSPRSEEYFYYDSTYLYSKDKLSVEEMSEVYLLYLMSKSTEFSNLITQNELLTKTEICNKDGKIRIADDEIEKIIEERFKKTNIQHQDFIYTYYLENEFSTYIRFVYSDGYYVSVCDVEKSEDLKFKSVAIPTLELAQKEKDYITINVKVPFLTKDKVYSDYKLTNIISDNIDEDILSYVKNADEYVYYYILENNYYKKKKIVKSRN